MFSVGDIIARVKADTSEFTRGMAVVKSGLNGAGSHVNNLASKFRGFASNVGSSLSQAGAMAAGLVSRLAIAGAAIGALGGFAVKAAGDLEQSRIAFTTLLGDAEKADDLLAKIEHKALITPFELPNLRKGVQMLVAADIEGDRALNTMMAMGDAVSAVGGGQAEMDRLLANLQQIKATGRAAAIDVRQFAMAGIPIYGLLAESMGVAESGILQMVSAGKIGFDEVEKALLDASAEGGRFYGAMEGQSKSLFGIISNLKDTMGKIFKDIAMDTGLFDGVKNAAQKFLGFLEDNQQNFVQWLKNIVDFIKKYKAPIIGAIGMFTAILIGFKIAALFNPLTYWVLAGAALGLVVQKLIEHFGGLEVVMGMISEIFATAMGYIKPVWDALLGIAITVFNALWPSLVALFNTIATNVIPIFNNLKGIFITLWPILKVVGIIIGATIVGALWLFINALNVLIPVINFLLATIRVVFSVIGVVVTAVINNMVAAFQFWYAIVRGYIQAVLAYFRFVFNTIKNVVGFVVNLLTGDFTGAWESIKKIWGGVATFFKGIVSAVSGALSGASEALMAPWRKAFDWLGEKAEWAKNQLNKLNPFSRNSPSLVDWITKGTGVIQRQYGDMMDTVGSMAGDVRTDINPAFAAAGTQPLVPAANAGGGDNININLDGIMTDSQGGVRRVGEQLVEAINQKKRAQNKPQIGAA